MVARALEAADLLAAEGISAAVLNMASIVPLDEAAVLRAAAETGAIVTAEEGVARGGLGAAVAELVEQHNPVPMRILGVTGFAPTGSAAQLLDHFGLNATGIAHAARAMVAPAKVR
jgi:transketolase